VHSASAKLRCPKCQAVFIAHKEPSPEAVIPGQTSSRPASSPKPRRTALLADEPRAFRDFVAEVLSEAEFEVGLTDNGEEALLLAGGHRFDLILLNVYLRRMLGINVCERLKSDPATRAVPVVLIGALVRQEEGGLPRGLYGADDFVPTSIGRGELLERIRRFVPDLPILEAGPAPTAPGREAAPTREEEEIRRLARIMVSDIQMYHPEKFNRALREGTFFESFAEELGKGKEILDQRFGHLASRLQILAAGLRDTLSGMRPSSAKRASGE
jgi:CheY-like chemotaxis protein